MTVDGPRQRLLQETHYEPAWFERERRELFVNPDSAAMMRTEFRGRRRPAWWQRRGARERSSATCCAHLIERPGCGSRGEGDAAD